jgi:serine O-acetyltransferase
MHDPARVLCTAVRALAPEHAAPYRPLPSSTAVAGLMEQLRGVLFPGYFLTAELDSEATYHSTGAALHESTRELERQIARALCFVSEDHGRGCTACPQEAQRIADQLVGRLPEVQQRLLGDVRAAYDGDPAASGPEEAILSYPGVLAITYQRVAHELASLGVPLIPRMITERAHALTGIDIHPGARIGERFFIDHGTGVVIGETCVISSNVRLYQGVTLGARSFPTDAHGALVKGLPRHPIIEDGVVIYAGATVLGRITVGRGSVIGGNVWVTESVAPGSIVTQGAARRETYDGGAGI